MTTLREPLRVALIGAGRIGRIHADNLTRTAGARLACVCDADPGAAAALAAQCHSVVATVEHALDDAAIDTLLIASSTDTHADLIEAGARSGKSVFCEKPLDLDLARARRCVEAAGRAGIVLRLGFNRRYDPSFARLKAELLAGAIGPLATLAITSRDPAPPPIEYVRRSGGLFRDMMIHDFDMARWLLAEEPVEVYARGACFVDPAIGAAGDVDTAAVLLTTASGRMCQITNSRRCSFGYDQRIEAFGAAGMLRADNATATHVEHASAAGFTTEPALPFFLERYAEAYRRELLDFVRACAGESVELATAEDGVRALVLADAAQRSHETGRPVTVAAGTGR
ncbi:MAG TPA: inositol 2-dehydrogenase [Steroidobacteraceae bacterium]|nr:inositol 2-dehydrogenase [Steroidobacteraceae bacterium]